MTAAVDFTTEVAKWLHRHGAVEEAALTPSAKEGRVELSHDAIHKLRGGQARCARDGVARTPRLRRSVVPPSLRAAGKHKNAVCACACVCASLSPTSHGADAARLRPSPRTTQAFVPLLQSLFSAHGQLCSISAEALAPGHDPRVCLKNWGLLLPQLRKSFAIDVTADEKTLLIGGGACVPPGSKRGRQQCAQRP
jgi:hypothetical protein